MRHMIVASGAAFVLTLTLTHTIGCTPDEHRGLAGPLVVIAKAGRTPYDAIVARATLDPKIVHRVQNPLLRLSIHTEEGRSALRASSSVDGFMPIPPGHCDSVIALARRQQSAPVPSGDGDGGTQ